MSTIKAYTLGTGGSCNIPFVPTAACTPFKTGKVPPPDAYGAKTLQAILDRAPE